jgi:hypothetical protein
MLTTDQFLKAKIVEVSWRFGSSYSGGHLAGQMVMSALANRFRAGFGSWMQILENIPMYMAENEIPPLKLDTVWNASFTKLLHAVEGVYDGSAQDMTKGALYWGELNKIERSWFQSRIIDSLSEATGLRQHPMVSNLNSLSFFK